MVVVEVIDVAAAVEDIALVVGVAVVVVVGVSVVVSCRTAYKECCLTNNL